MVHQVLTRSDNHNEYLSGDPDARCAYPSPAWQPPSPRTASQLIILHDVQTPNTSSTATFSSHASHPGHRNVAQFAPLNDLPCQPKMRPVTVHSATTPDTVDAQPNCQSPATIGGSANTQSPAETVPTNQPELRAVGTSNASPTRRPTRPAHHIVVEPVHPQQQAQQTIEDDTSRQDGQTQRHTRWHTERAAVR